MCFVSTCTIIIGKRLPQSNKKEKNQRWKVNKAKQRLYSINKSQKSMKNRELNFGPLKRRLIVPHRKYTFLFHCI